MFISFHNVCGKVCRICGKVLNFNVSRSSDLCPQSITNAEKCQGGGDKLL